jgi:hypothetical protein
MSKFTKIRLTKFSESMVDLMDGRAICIDKSDQWYGLIFFKDPDDCSWVSKRKATRLEMTLAFTRKKMIKTSTMNQNEPSANQLTDNSCANIPYTPEEDAEFARIERNQQISEFACIERNQDIALLANVIRQSPTTSAEAIAARVLDAGYQFSGSAVQLK